MKYFTEGLTKDALKKAYHKLAMKYHPDMPNGSEAAMKELNTEYDNYYTSLTASNDVKYSWSSWDDIFKKAREEAEESRKFIIYMMKNERKPGQFIGIDRDFVPGHNSFWDYLTDNTQKSHYVRKFYFPDKSWTDVHEGLARVEVTEDKGKNCFVIKGENLKMECPSYVEMAEHLIDDMWFMGIYHDNTSLSDKIIYVEKPYGSFYMSGHKDKLYAKIDGKLMSAPVNPEQFKDVPTDNSACKIDMPFIAYLNCTADEFVNSTYVDWRSDFDTALCMVRRYDADFSYSGLVYHAVKIGVINVYESSRDRSMRYATFNFEKLVKELRHLNNDDDIDELIDFVNKSVDEFNEKVKGKIKKGKLKVII